MILVYDLRRRWWPERQLGKRSRRAHFAVGIILSSLMIACVPILTGRRPSPTQAPPGVPAVRLARLARCVDIARWFWAVSDATPQHFQSYLSDTDLGLIHQLGFTCVRLSIDPDLIYHKSMPSQPDALMLGYVDGAVRRLLAHDLGVIIDLHDDPLKPLEQDPDYAAGFAPFWHTLAHHYSSWDANMVFLEVLNEPVFQHAPEHWLPIQRRLLSAMRAGAPSLTLIATGPLWSSIAGLLLVKPVADRNVVYTFHFYEPATFTHQGAVWWVDGLDRYMSKLPYPVTPSRCRAAVATFVNADVRMAARNYCAGNWNAAKVTALIAEAAQWSRTNRAPVMVGEFGVYCKYAPRADRIFWFRTVHHALSEHGIGWNLWAYDDCYGLGRQPDDPGQITIDWGVVRALGLDVSARTHLATGS